MQFNFSIRLKLTKALLSLSLVLTLYGFASIHVSFAQTPALTVTPTATPQSPRGRMEGTFHTRPPRTFDAQHYSIRTRFDVPNKTVIGDETVTLKPLAANFNSFTLDAANMNIESVTLEGKNAPLRFTASPDKLTINLDRAYAPAETITIRIRYRATPQRGIYFVSPAPGTNAARPSKPAQIWTQGEPEDNHYWFPCYDFPDDKATSEQFITVPQNQIAISNGVLLDKKTNGDGTQTFHWSMSTLHSSYLISLIVGDFARVTDAYKNIAVEYYTYHNTETEARRSFGKTPQMMRWFSEALRYEYPYNKYAQTVVAGFIFGGMENVTATTQADTEILNRADEEPQTSADNLVSHELAHQWFGDLVTCKDWSQAWLNEGFATFMEASFKEHEAGHDAYLFELRNDARAYMRDDNARYRRPLVYNRYRAPIDLFDATLYQKGALVLHMLRGIVGDETFWKALNLYLKENEYRNVETADLQRAFEKVSNRKLDWFFDQWVTKAGYPELRVRYVYDAAAKKLTLNVAQTQMPDDITPAVFRLPVEIEVADAKSSRTEQIEITQREQSFTFSLGGEPRMIRFDKDSRLLKTLDFPQSTKMLSYQLTHSADAIGRIEAAEALAHIATKQVSLGEEKNPVVEALQQALTTDSFYGVRVAAADRLARLSHEDHAAEALVAGAADKDSRVRAAVIGALKDSANLKAIEAVRGALNDPSPFVIVAAMAGALKQGDDAARIAVVEIASRQNVAPRVIITAMLSLASLQRAEALPLAMKAVKADQSMEVRRAGLRALYRIGTHDPKAIERLISLLDDSERDIRYAAIQILGELKATSAAGALLRLSKEDRQADVRKAATAALAQLNKPSNEKASAAIDAEPRSTDVP